MPSKTIKAGLGTLSLFVLITAIAFSIHKDNHEYTTIQENIAPVTAEQLAAPIITNPGLVHTITVKKGDTLASLFDRLHLSEATLENVTASSLANAHLTHIQPGQRIRFTIAKQHDLQQISYPYDRDSTLYVSKTQNGYTADVKSKPVTIALEYRAGTVNHSLAQAVERAGFTTGLYEQLHDIFQGTIDFNHGIRRGDHFAILFQEYYIDGKKDHPGNIVVASFTNQHKNYRAFRYTYPKNHTGYYTLQGKGVLPLFLKAPVHYKRISSFFTYHRMDPYLHVMRPHLGIDYAAAEGTPIHSIGNGYVLFAGRDHGYGNSVVIRYSRKYKTLYGHMEKFAKGLHSGEFVKRGQIIGYIGSTGWSTGPHLHFEMYVYGIPKNPLKMKFPGGQPIPASYAHKYLNYAHNMLARFKIYQDAGFAENGSNQVNE